ncbi:hypothetical protein VZT92_019726 [Zoarces viviparus]|uniref:Secreted protein n=1 Tax=Zoarces viviparus TaxID=48416 RepID=A0AAW1EMG4_ZOAVI
MVCQNLLEANRKSFSMASPNSSHARVLAFATTAAAALLACRYLSAASGDPWANQALKVSFFSLTASLTSGVHHRVLGLPPRQAPMTFRPQLLAAASTIEALNMVHSDSMSPTSLGMCEKFFRRCELKTSRTGSSARRSQFTLTTRLGLPGLSNRFPCHLIQLTTRW